MAIVSVINSNWTQIAGKNLTRQAALTGGLKETVICVTVGMCCNYPMCQAGYTVDLSACGRITTIISAVPENVRTAACCTILTVTAYVPAMCDAAATGTLHLYEGATMAVVACCTVPAALTELPDCATDAACKTVRFHVTGF